MNTTTNNLLSDLKGLLKLSVKMADRQNMDQIFFSKTRAKELLLTLTQIEKESLKSCSKHIKKTPAWLDNPY